MGKEDKYMNASNSRAVKTPDVRGSARIGRGTPGSPTKFRDEAESETSKEWSENSVPGSSSENTV
ncbi:MAG: hypothetical protein EOP06_27905 [Proteobacteria bacterium]|nr:MAG: hypothetical protein EOP06_27905 [Pseudomonadota bacterium]